MREDTRVFIEAFTVGLLVIVLCNPLGWLLVGIPALIFFARRWKEAHQLELKFRESELQWKCSNKPEEEGDNQ